MEKHTHVTHLHGETYHDIPNQESYSIYSRMFVDSRMDLKDLQKIWSRERERVKT